MPSVSGDLEGAVSHDESLPSYPEYVPDLGDLRTRFMTSNSEFSVAVQEIQQLPTPSPSPSRSVSPSLVATDDSSAEWTGTLSLLPNGNKHSTSFERVTARGVEKEEGRLTSPPPISKILPAHELHDIPEERIRKPRKLSASKPAEEKVLKLSPAEMHELTSAPESLPVTSPQRAPAGQQSLTEPFPLDRIPHTTEISTPSISNQPRKVRSRSGSQSNAGKEVSSDRQYPVEDASASTVTRRPGFSSRTTSTPVPATTRMASYNKGTPVPTSPKRKSVSSGSRPEPLNLNTSNIKASQNSQQPDASDLPSPLPQSIPLPPMSIPTYLQLELSATQPSPLYIYRSASSDYPYESSKLKFERLLNFLYLPPQLEQVLLFGSLACLDAWLYTFTILPLRFFKALAVLIKWWGQVLAKEARFITGFIYHGVGRMWNRRKERRNSNTSSSRSRSVSRSGRPPISSAPSYQSQTARTLDVPGGRNFAEQLKAGLERKSRPGWGRRHRRTKSHPSSLSSHHKADLLQGAVIICSCLILMRLDASRMYHSIKGQAAIKLYVIYNVLEVCDRLFSALGQDIFECLFSDETLERNPDGRSKILRPLGMFFLALAYNAVHAAALLYQVITLNVAVNSYSNALLTLLMSNQFVEIKSTVFKKFEKDNIFQLTCADVVERFQLWLMLLIIAMRNIVEVGGLSALSAAEEVVTKASSQSNTLLPNSFQLLPRWSGEVLSPFMIVLGSEMLVDWIKHSYISKFNGVQPAVYERFLDILAKDYYTNAFVNQNLVKRLGLPVIPLSCLFIRALFQVYNMFLATHMPPPLPSTATALSLENIPTPVTTAALEHFDTLIRSALGRSAFGIPDPAATGPWYLPSADDVIATLTMLIFFLGAFLVMLAFKLVLGMLLLKFARNRYSSMKKREHLVLDTGGKRVGGWGTVEVDDDKRRWIYDDDPEGYRKLKERERLSKERAEKGVSTSDFSKISRAHDIDLIRFPGVTVYVLEATGDTFNISAF
ncbi:eukaryotic membrane protein family [Phlyctema vagabunda]|uniref:Eukaryotic membrane protein family n=1 Tax=Phlyctema vagabunda TaxID=108571 RepID=A0ABR4PEQ3_9HELO